MSFCSGVSMLGSRTTTGLSKNKYAPQGSKQCIDCPREQVTVNEGSTDMTDCINQAAVCERINVTQKPGHGSSDSKLAIWVVGEEKEPTILIERQTDAEYISLSKVEGKKFSAEHVMKTGTWILKTTFQPSGLKCPSQQLTVSCSADFEERNGQCVSQDKIACGDVTVKQENSPSTDHSEVAVTVSDTPTKPALRIAKKCTTIAPTVMPALSTGAWSAKYKLPPGGWDLQYTSGGTLGSTGIPQTNDVTCKAEAG